MNPPIRTYNKQNFKVIGRIFFRIPIIGMRTPQKDKMADLVDLKGIQKFRLILNYAYNEKE